MMPSSKDFYRVLDKKYKSSFLAEVIAYHEIYFAFKLFTFYQLVFMKRCISYFDGKEIINL